MGLLIDNSFGGSDISRPRKSIPPMEELEDNSQWPIQMGAVVFFDQHNLAVQEGDGLSGCPSMWQVSDIFWGSAGPEFLRQLLVVLEFPLQATGRDNGIFSFTISLMSSKEMGRGERFVYIKQMSKRKNWAPLWPQRAKVLISMWIKQRLLMVLWRADFTDFISLSQNPPHHGAWGTKNYHFGLSELNELTKRFSAN